MPPNYLLFLFSLSVCDSRGLSDSSNHKAIQAARLYVLSREGSLTTELHSPGLIMKIPLNSKK